MHSLTHKPHHIHPRHQVVPGHHHHHRCLHNIPRTIHTATMTTTTPRERRPNDISSAPRDHYLTRQFIYLYIYNTPFNSLLAIIMCVFATESELADEHITTTDHHTIMLLCLYVVSFRMLFGDCTRTFTLPLIARFFAFA